MKHLMKPFEVVGIIGLVTMLSVTFVSILSRYILPVAWAFTEELVCAIFIIVSLIGAALAIAEGKAMGISLLTDMMPPKAQKALSVVQGGAIFVFAALLVRYGISMVQSEMKVNMRTAALGWPEAIFGSFIPIGGVTIGLAAIIYVVNVLRKKPETPASSKEDA